MTIGQNPEFEQILQTPQAGECKAYFELTGPNHETVKLMGNIISGVVGKFGEEFGTTITNVDLSEINEDTIGLDTLNPDLYEVITDVQGEKRAVITRELMRKFANDEYGNTRRGTNAAKLLSLVNPRVTRQVSRDKELSALIVEQDSASSAGKPWPGFDAIGLIKYLAPENEQNLPKGGPLTTARVRFLREYTGKLSPGIWQ